VGAVSDRAVKTLARILLLNNVIYIYVSYWELQ